MNGQYQQQPGGNPTQYGQQRVGAGAYGLQGATPAANTTTQGGPPVKQAAFVQNPAFAQQHTLPNGNANGSAVRPPAMGAAVGQPPQPQRTQAVQGLAQTTRTNPAQPMMPQQQPMMIPQQQQQPMMRPQAVPAGGSQSRPPYPAAPDQAMRNMSLQQQQHQPPTQVGGSAPGPPGPSFRNPTPMVPVNGPPMSAPGGPPMGNSPPVGAYAANGNVPGARAPIPGGPPPPGPGMKAPQPPSFGNTSRMQPTSGPVKGAVGAAAVAGAARGPQQGSTGSSAQRINPAQMPRPKEVGAKAAVFETRNFGNSTTSTSYGVVGNSNVDRSNIFSSSASIPPPSASSKFVVHDFGNCSPRFMRSTVYQVPATNDLRKTSAMPLAVVCQPLAQSEPEDTHAAGLPVVDATAHGPVRCEQCKAYMNPFVRWLDGGRRFQCNLCGQMNETPAHYFCNVGAGGVRTDSFDRPELSYGSMEYIAGAGYSVKASVPLSCVFVIDATDGAVSSGTTHRICEAIISCLRPGQGGQIAPAKVGIATFGSVIQYFTMKPGSGQPQIVVVPDVDSPYAPLPSSLLIDVQANSEDAISLLEFVMSLHSPSKVVPQSFGEEMCCGTAAVHSAGKLLQKDGGKVVAFIASMTSVGEGAADPLKNGSRQALDRHVWPKTDTSAKIAIELSEAQVCVDILALGKSSTFLNLAGLRLLPETTGGSFKWYQGFDPCDSSNGDAKCLCHDLRHNLTREQGYEALLRVRASSGLQIQEYKGSFCVRTVTDIDLAGIDADKSIVAYFTHEEKLSESTEVCFQCALLYTTSSGQRRIRVHTLSLPTTNVLGSVFRSADLDSQMHAILRPVIARCPVASQVQQVKDEATTACVNILYAYRRYCATSSSSGQLILPEALKLMPLYMLACNKLPALNPKCEIDERASLVCQISGISISEMMPLLMPRMAALHELVPKEPGEGNVSGVPGLLSCSSEAMADDAVLVLMENTLAFVWIGTGVYPTVLEKLFGETSFEKIKNKLERALIGPSTPKGDPGTCLAFGAISQLNPGRHLRLHFVPRGSIMETKFLAKLIEDRTGTGLSYVEYLCHLHRQIQNKFM